MCFSCQHSDGSALAVFCLKPGLAVWIQPKERIAGHLKVSMDAAGCEQWIKSGKRSSNQKTRVATRSFHESMILSKLNHRFPHAQQHFIAFHEGVFGDEADSRLAVMENKCRILVFGNRRSGGGCRPTNILRIVCPVVFTLGLAHGP